MKPKTTDIEPGINRDWTMPLPDPPLIGTCIHGVGGAKMVNGWLTSPYCEHCRLDQSLRR